MNNIRFFLSENSPFLVVKFSIYFNRRVFVMDSTLLLLQDCLLYLLGVFNISIRPVTIYTLLGLHCLLITRKSVPVLV